MLDVPVVASSGQRAFSRSCCDWLKPLGASEKNGNFQEQMELVNTISRSQSLAMADDYLLQAVDRAWALYQAAHNDVRVDERRAEHLQQRWKARENDAGELTCARLAYLERLLSEAE